MRYCQAFTVDGVPIGTARLLWAELRPTAKGTIALHRFRPNGGTEQPWRANGEAAGSAPLRLPLDVINVSSGFGLRAARIAVPNPNQRLSRSRRPSRRRSRRPRLPRPSRASSCMTGSISSR